MTEEPRLPLVTVSPPTRDLVQKAMVHAGLING